MPGCLVVAVEHIVQAAAEYWVASPAANRRGFLFANIICRIILNIPTLAIISDLNTGWTSGRVVLLICSVSFQTSERSLWLSTVLNYAPPLLEDWFWLFFQGGDDLGGGVANALQMLYAVCQCEARTRTSNSQDPGMQSDRMLDNLLLFRSQVDRGHKSHLLSVFPKT